VKLPQVALLAAAINCVIPNVGLAQEASEGDARRALDLTRTALELYERGEIEECVTLLQEAHALHPEPIILYNLARAEEALGHLREALQAYEQYLTDAPDIAGRGAIQQRVTALRDQIAEQERLAEERATARREAEEARERARRAGEAGAGPWPLIVSITGGAIVGSGVVLGLLAQSEEQKAADSTVHRSTVDHFDKAESFATAANVTLVVGGVVAAAGLTWLSFALLGGDEDPAQASLTVAPTGLELSGRF